MKRITRLISIFLLLSILFGSCSSTTMIQSNPSKAKVYLDGILVGETPYLHIDTKIVGSSMVLKLEKEGYTPLISTITKDEELNVGALIGGLFFTIPYLWTMQYHAIHHYELTPSAVENKTKSENTTFKTD